MLLSERDDSEAGRASSIIVVIITSPRPIWIRHTSLPRFVYFNIISFAEDPSTNVDQSFSADWTILRKSFWCNFINISLVRLITDDADKPKKSRVSSTVPQFSRISIRIETSIPNCGRRWKKKSQERMILRLKHVCNLSIFFLQENDLTEANDLSQRYYRLYDNILCS